SSSDAKKNPEIISSTNFLLSSQISEIISTANLHENKKGNANPRAKFINFEQKVLNKNASKKMNYDLFPISLNDDDIPALIVAPLLPQGKSTVSSSMSSPVLKISSLPKKVQDFKKEQKVNSLTQTNKALIKPKIQEFSRRQNIIEIINHLMSTQYIAYGNWSCSKCDYEWQIRYDKVILEKCLKKTAKEFRGFFQKRCNNCGDKRRNWISSFRLFHNKPAHQNYDPAFEIIVHLVWNNHYRAFGRWRCCRCARPWYSGYIWMSLQKFIDSVQPSELVPHDDYYMQKCYTCVKNNFDDTGRIVHFEPLKKAVGISEHQMDLCAKCQSGFPCRPTGTYFGLYSLI
ncbi:4366_t:CDS:2, partial [Ambispora leptoticha]